jgi:hypothetical protein
MIILVVTPMIISLFYKPFVSAADLISQAALLLTALAIPFFEHSLVKVIRLPFTLGVIWGIWRFLYFDIVTHNDIPGIGYFFPPITFGVIASVAYLFCALISVIREKIAIHRTSPSSQSLARRLFR